MNFFDPDRLTSKDGAEINFFASQADASAARDHDDLVVEWIVNVRKSLVDARGRLVDLGRALHAQRFVRTLVVEHLDELVEAGLQLQKVLTRGLSGFFFLGRRDRPDLAYSAWSTRTYYNPSPSIRLAGSDVAVCSGRLRVLDPGKSASIDQGKLVAIPAGPTYFVTEFPLPSAPAATGKLASEITGQVIAPDASD